MILCSIFQIIPCIPVEQQVYIVNWSIIHQLFQFAALVHIPGNLRFHQSAVNVNLQIAVPPGRRGRNIRPVRAIIGGQKAA